MALRLNKIYGPPLNSQQTISIIIIWKLTSLKRELILVLQYFHFTCSYGQLWYFVL